MRIRSRFVNARASRSALIAASVPEETSRTFSIDGTASTISAASSTSASVAAPKLVPRSAASRTASTVSGSAWPKSERPPGHDPVEERAAVVGLDVRAVAAADEERLVEPDRAHRPHGRVDAAGDQLERAPVEVSVPTSRQSHARGGRVVQ